MNEVVVYSDNVKKLTTEIKVIQDNVCQGMIEIGKRLIEIKKEVGHGNWIRYLENELGYTQKTAQRLMKVAKEFGNSKMMLPNNLASSKILELLHIPQEQREEFTHTVPVGDLTVKQLKEEIKKYNDISPSYNKSNQRKPIPSATVKQLIARSGAKCEICGKGNEYLASWLKAHHIIEHHKTQNDSMDNLIMLCPDCHGFIHDLKNVKDSGVRSNIEKGIVKLVGENTYNKIKLYI